MFPKTCSDHLLTVVFLVLSENCRSPHKPQGPSLVDDSKGGQGIHLTRLLLDLPSVGVLESEGTKFKITSDGLNFRVPQFALHICP